MIALPLTWLQNQFNGEVMSIPQIFWAPSKAVTVPAMIEEDDGAENRGNLSRLRHGWFDGFQPGGDFLHEASRSSDRAGGDPVDAPEIFPSGNTLSLEADSWIQGAAEGRVGFYSAMEEEVFPRPAARPKGQAAPKKGQKKPSVAKLAEQLSTLSSSCPHDEPAARTSRRTEEVGGHSGSIPHTAQNSSIPAAFYGPFPKDPQFGQVEVHRRCGPSAKDQATTFHTSSRSRSSRSDGRRGAKRSPQRKGT